MNNEKKNIDKSPDFLVKMKEKKEGYEVPFNYFDNLENSIMDTIYTENRKAAVVLDTPSLWQRLFQNRAPFYAFGMIVLVLGVFFLLQPTSVDLEGGMLTAESVESYIDDNIDEFSYELLISELTEEETASLDFASDDITIEDIPDEYWDEIADEDIEEYL